MLLGESSCGKIEKVEKYFTFSRRCLVGNRITVASLWDKIEPRLNKEPVKAIAKELGIHYASIYKEARKLGLPRFDLRPQNNSSSDIHYFNTWSDDMAYILGFIFADGSIAKTERMVAIEVSGCDVCVLKFIKQRLQSTKKIKRAAHKHRGTKPSRYLRISSKLLVESLKRRGVQCRKTFRDDPFPDVPKKFLPHFIRGFFDGDGSVFSAERGKGSCHVKFIGTPNFLKGLRKALTTIGMKHKKIKFTKGKEATWGNLDWSHPNELRLFYRYIYPEGFSFCLERKRRRLWEWLVKPRVEMQVNRNNARELGFPEPLSLGEYRKCQQI